MADTKLLMSILLFIVIFDIFVGLFAFGSDEIDGLKMPEKKELTVFSAPGILIDWAGVFIDVAFATFAILPWWLSALFFVLNITVIGIMIDLLWI